MLLKVTVEDVVGIRIVDAKRGERALLSWGRIFDRVDPNQLLTRIRSILPGMGYHDVVELTLCDELSELRDFGYFYEGLIHFAARAASPEDVQRDLCMLASDDAELRKSLYFLGPPAKRAH